MLVQLGRAIAPQVTSTNWTDLSTCRCKRFNYCTHVSLHVSLNSLMKLTNLSCKLLCLTVIMYCITSCQMSKAKDINLGLKLTVSPWHANRPFTITVISSHVHVCCSVTPIDERSFIRYCFQLHFCFALFNAACHCSIKPIWWWW